MIVKRLSVAAAAETATMRPLRARRAEYMRDGADGADAAPAMLWREDEVSPAGASRSGRTAILSNLPPGPMLSVGRCIGGAMGYRCATSAKRLDVRMKCAGASSLATEPTSYTCQLSLSLPLLL